MKNTKYTLLHKYYIKDKIPLKLPTLKIGNKVIEKTPFIKFLGVMLDENVSWKYQIKTVENKLSKSNGFLCRTKQFLDETSLNIFFIYSFFFKLHKYCIGQYPFH